MTVEKHNSLLGKCLIQREKLNETDCVHEKPLGSFKWSAADANPKRIKSIWYGKVH